MAADATQIRTLIERWAKAVRPSTQGGDLVLLHAIGVHGLVLLALPAVLLARTSMRPGAQWRVIAIAVASVAVAMSVLLGQALRQLPIEQPHPIALVALGLCAAGLLAAAIRVAAAVLAVPETDAQTRASDPFDKRRRALEFPKLTSAPSASAHAFCATAIACRTSRPRGVARRSCARRCLGFGSLTTSPSRSSRSATRCTAWRAIPRRARDLRHGGWLVFDGVENHPACQRQMRRDDGKTSASWVPPGIISGSSSEPRTS